MWELCCRGLLLYIIVFCHIGKGVSGRWVSSRDDDNLQDQKSSFPRFSNFLDLTCLTINIKNLIEIKLMDSLCLGYKLKYLIIDTVFYWPNLFAPTLGGFVVSFRGWSPRILLSNKKERYFHRLNNRLDISIQLA